MGGVGSEVVSFVSPRKEAGVIIVGPDEAGKTTLLFRLTGVTPAREIEATVGFELDTLQIGNLHLHFWNLGGGTPLRPMWRMYFREARAVIFVIDSADRTRMGLAVTEFTHLLDEAELRGVPILIIANKKDKPERMERTEFVAWFHLSDIQDREWALYYTDALTGEGVSEALEWMSRRLEANM
jgi:small GTP-binding protein